MYTTNDFIYYCFKGIHDVIPKFVLFTEFPIKVLLILLFFLPLFSFYFSLLSKSSHPPKKLSLKSYWLSQICIHCHSDWSQTSRTGSMESQKSVSSTTGMVYTIKPLHFPVENQQSCPTMIVGHPVLDPTSTVGDIDFWWSLWGHQFVQQKYQKRCSFLCMVPLTTTSSHPTTTFLDYYSKTRIESTH